MEREKDPKHLGRSPSPETTRRLRSINFTLFAQTDSGSTTRALARRLDASLGLWTASAAASDAADSVTLRIGHLAGAPANAIPVPSPLGPTAFALGTKWRLTTTSPSD